MTYTPERSHRVGIVGGGIAGLAAANRVQELARMRDLALDLVLLEARNRLGGTIATERTGGFVIEAGPDSFISEKPWGLALCQRLGLDDRLMGTRDGNRRTFVVRGRRLHPLPEGFLLLAPTRFWPLLTSSLFSWPGKLRMGLDLLLPRGATRSDESLGSLVRRRLGREALERVAQPLVGGIYTADPDTLSLAATMPRFLEMEKKHRSIIIAMARQQHALRRQARARQSAAGRGSGARWSLFVSLAGGMQQLVDSLAGRLPAAAARLSAPVSHLAPAASPGGWRIGLADGIGIDLDAVILACPSHHSACLLSTVDPTLGNDLGTIEYASSLTVTLAYARTDVPHPLDGFGFVVPSIEGRPIIACTFSSMKFAGRAPESHVLLRCFAGGALGAAATELDDAEIEAAVRGEMADLLGIVAEPALLRIHRHQRAMPQYRVGHLDLIGRIDRRLAAHRGLAVAGSAYRGVGIPDCVRSGEMAAETVIAALGEAR